MRHFLATRLFLEKGSSFSGNYPKKIIFFNTGGLVAHIHFRFLAHARVQMSCAGVFHFDIRVSDECLSHIARACLCCSGRDHALLSDTCTVLFVLDGMLSRETKNCLVKKETKNCQKIVCIGSGADAAPVRSRYSADTAPIQLRNGSVPEPRNGADTAPIRLRNGADTATERKRYGSGTEPIHLRYGSGTELIRFRYGSDTSPDRSRNITGTEPCWSCWSC